MYPRMVINRSPVDRKTTTIFGKNELKMESFSFKAKDIIRTRDSRPRARAILKILPGFLYF